MKITIPLVLLNTALACLGANISGTITYSGAATGAVHIALQQTVSGNRVLNLGGADSVEIPGLTSLAGSELTVQYWFRGSTYQSAVRQQSSGWIVAGWNGTHILANDGGTAGVSAGDGITDGKWHHVLVTWKQGATDGFASYLDGRPVQKRASSNTAIPNYAASVWIGSFNNLNEFTTGQMDAVAIWQRFMTPDEVAANWNKALTGNESGLLAYYDFNDDTFNDKSANHYDGIAYGGAAVGAADIPGFNGANVDLQIALAGTYTATGLPTGPGYVVTAYMDGNGNGRYDPGEPTGSYAGNPFTLTGDQSGVDIVLAEPPRITVNPVAARRAVGGAVSFQVAALGTEPLSYRWYRDDVALSDNGRINGAGTPNLQLTELVAGDSGGYSCLVTNPQGKAVSKAANLDVAVNGKTISGTFIYSGTRTGMVYTTLAQLRTNKALGLDGTTASAVTTLIDLSGEELSIEYWFKGSSVSSAVRQQGGPGYIVAGWGANYHILSNDGGVAQPVKVSDPLTAVVDGNWHHVAMTWKRNIPNGFVSYFDGEIVQQRDSSSAAIHNIGSYVYFGAWDGKSEFSRGLLDEISIWSRALTRAEIRSHARNGLTGAELNLLGYWNFDDGTGKDLSPNGNNAELNGAAAIVDAVNPGLGANYTDVFSGPGPFEILGIPAGNGYSLLAYLDANSNGTQDGDDPRGAYAGNPFDITADVANLEVVLLDPPAVLTNASDVTVAPGDTIRLSVVAAGTANTYQWQHYSIPLVDGGRVSGAQTPQLTITGAQPADGGAYSLWISNSLGQVASAPVAVIVQPASLTNGLVAYYTFDESSGATAAESTGLSAPGQLNGFPGDNSEWVPGLINHGLNFVATNGEWVLAPDYTKPTSTMAVSAWVWAQSLPTWASVAKNWGASLPGQFHLGLDGDSGRPSIYITDGSTNTLSAVANDALPLEGWHQVAFVATSSRARLYLDGKEVAASAPYDGTLLATVIPSLAIGAKTDDSGSQVAGQAPGYWDGKLDDLGIWARALSPDEIQGIYMSGLAGKGILEASAVKSVRLGVALTGNNQVTIQYEAGTLQWKDDLAGAWSDVPNAQPPSYNLTPAGKKFFRVR